MMIRRSSVLFLLLLLPVLAAAQIDPRFASSTHRPSPAMPKMMLPGGMKAPEGLFDEFWKDAATAAELQLSESQMQQLDEQALQSKLTLIGEGADGMKSFVKLSAILDAESFDDAAYKNEVEALAATTSKAVQNVADMAAARRRILSGEQYAKLRALEKAKKEKEAAEHRVAAQSCISPGRSQAAPRVPSSLGQPLR